MTKFFSIQHVYAFESNSLPAILPSFGSKWDSATDPMCLVVTMTEMFISLKKTFEGQGIYANVKSKSDIDIKNLFYACDKKPYMLWI